MNRKLPYKLKHLHILVKESTHDYLRKSAVKEKTTVTRIIEEIVAVRKVTSDKK